MEEQNAQLYEELVAAKSEVIFNKVSTGMTAVQLSKFKDLAESVEFTGKSDYVNKLNTIKESYFSNKAPKKEMLEDATNSTSNESVGAYVSAISKNIKFV